MSGKGKPAPKESGSRIWYIDNLRIFLIALVVIHQTTVGYGGSGDWAIKEMPTDAVSPAVFFLFNTVNQSYLVSFFYFLAGYFLVGSYNRKGPWKCLKDRLIRLGIPLLIYILFVAPLVEYAAINLAYGKGIPLTAVFSHFLEYRRIVVGPLWFLEGLLVFSIVYVLTRAMTDRVFPDFEFKPFAEGFPPNKFISLSIVSMTLATFAVRTEFPVGTMLMHIQPGHFVNYIFCFWLGTLARRGSWLDHLSVSQGRRWGLVALIVITLLPIVIATTMKSGGGPQAFTGGHTWMAFIAAYWESMACLSIITALFYIFQNSFHRQGRILKIVSANVYTVFIIHQLVITFIMAILVHAAFPTVVKFILLSLIGLPLCFAFSHFVIRKIPYAAKVLG